MRPGDFSPGNPAPPPGASAARATACFNEAGGFLPRKPLKKWERRIRSPQRASMRPGDFSPGNVQVEMRGVPFKEQLQ